MPFAEKVGTFIGILTWIAVIAAIGTWKGGSRWRWAIAAVAGALFVALHVVPPLLRA